MRDDIDAAEVAAKVLGSPSLDMGDQADQGAEDRDDGLSSRRAAKEALEAAVESLDRGSLVVVELPLLFITSVGRAAGSRWAGVPSISATPR